MSRPDGDGGNVITCTHDGLAEHLWEPPRCPVAIPAGTWAVRPAAGEFRVTTSAASPVWAATGEPFHARRSHRPAAPAAEADLREQIAGIWVAGGQDAADAVLALPALQRLVEQAAEAARLRAVVERVRDALNPVPADYATAADVVYDVRRALDGTDG